MFGTTLDPWDVKQGSAGDCYYMAACSAAGEFESRLKNAFLTQTYNSAGIVALNVYVLGVQKTMYIDDYLPFYGSSTTSTYLLFAK
jgi:calpain-15